MQMTQRLAVVFSNRKHLSVQAVDTFRHFAKNGPQFRHTENRKDIHFYLLLY